jgi:hypothetical protein
VEAKGDGKLRRAGAVGEWPGPSKRDLLNSSLPQVNDIHQFMVDRHRICHYSGRRVLQMYRWNSAGSNLDAARCRS